MIERLWKKFVNRETISYLIFGVLTTLVDWISYWYMRQLGIDYRIATAGSWAAAVLFAFVTNKLFVFNSWDLHPKRCGRNLYRLSYAGQLPVCSPWWR